MKAPMSANPSQPGILTGVSRSERALMEQA
jgi:hypothetical protein